MQLNRNNDLDFILTLRDAEGRDVGFPAWDWTAKFYTNWIDNAAEASSIGGKLYNCFNDDSRIHVVINNHKLDAGKLRVKFTAHIPNDIYPDGEQRVVVAEISGLDLVAGTGDIPTAAEIALQLPFVKIAFEDLTDEQKAELQKPAVEAAAEAKEAAQNANNAAVAATATEKLVGQAAERAEKALQSAAEAQEQAESAATRAEEGAEAAKAAVVASDELNKKITAAEAERVTAEEERVTAEQQRIAAENSRATAENDRSDNETSRSDAEQQRVNAEKSRVTAENQRSENESERRTAETSRSTAESGRAESERQRVAAESGRTTAESARDTAEADRVAAEKARATAETTREQAELKRSTAEGGRVFAEKERAAAEAAREERVETAETAATTATNAAGSAANSAASANESANASAQSAQAARVAAESAAKTADDLRDDVDGKVSKAGDTMTGNLSMPQVESTAPQGTAPMTVKSNTMVKGLNAEMVGGRTVSELPEIVRLFDKNDYDYVAVLLCSAETKDIGFMRLSGKLYTSHTASSRYQAADSDLWYSRWATDGYNRRFYMETYGLDVMWKIAEVTYEGKKWYALLHTNINATVGWFMGSRENAALTAIKYFNARNNTVLDEEIYNSIVDLSDQIQYKKSISDIRDRLDLVESDLGLAMSTAAGQYCVGAWDPNNLAPEATETRGNKEMLNDLAWWLIDATAAAEADDPHVLRPELELNPTNLLRTVDGGFAPVVGITEAQRAECDVVLYLDSEASQLYCEAGSFDPEAFYNEHGVDTPLYDAEGNAVRVLRPWETTETKYTVGVSFRDKVYLLDNKIGNSGKRWAGLFKKPVVWDGIELTEVDALPPTAFSPAQFTTRGGKARCFFYDYAGETYCISGNGLAGCTMFRNGKTYPRTVDVTQVSAMDFCRGENEAPTASYPRAEGGYHAMNALTVACEVANGTKYLHDPLLFGSGISANNTCNSEATWLANGGVRYRVDGSDAWTYQTWGVTPTNVAYNANGTKTYWFNMLSQEYPLEQCMESQMAMSYANEIGIAEGERFEFYGGTYWYQRVPGASGKQLNARVYKLMTTTLSAFDVDGNAQEVDVEVVLRFSLYSGCTRVGGNWAYCGGGLEIVGDYDHDQTVDRYNFPVKIYVEADQTKWHYEKTTNKVAGGDFDFENDYKLIYAGKTPANGYSRERLSGAPYSLRIGGGLSTGECFYDYSNTYWGTAIGNRCRIGSRFCGYANYGTCSPRFVHRYYGVAHATRTYGGFAQVLIKPQAKRRLQAGGHSATAVAAAPGEGIEAPS